MQANKGHQFPFTQKSPDTLILINSPHRHRGLRERTVAARISNVRKKVSNELMNKLGHLILVTGDSYNVT